ncbi:hypothetical protein KFU94_49615 [Chloroflexi bacterium TSY]|nr:hypothetical protein [Chloroflexi bacterium TSY]
MNIYHYRTQLVYSLLIVIASVLLVADALYHREQPTIAQRLQEAAQERSFHWIQTGATQP